MGERYPDSFAPATGFLSSFLILSFFFFFLLFFFFLAPLRRRSGWARADPSSQAPQMLCPCWPLSQCARHAGHCRSHN